MKPFCVMLMSLLLLATQFRGAGVPWGADSTAPRPSTGHSCCPPTEAVNCHAACCVAPAPAPVHPGTPVPSPQGAQRILLETPAFLALLWALPAPEVHPSVPSSLARNAAAPPGAPLYLRHEALLI